MRALRATLILALVGGCAGPEPGSDAWLLDEGERYLADPAFRREVLEGSLESQGNVYARERLANYGLETSGWDRLPEWSPRSARATAEVADRLVRGEPVDDALVPVWSGDVPTTMEGWVALGRDVFFRYPLRADPYVEHALARPELDAGVARDAAGEAVGVVAFRDVDGATRVGAARRELDYGRLRVTYHADTGRPIDAAMRARMERWGPGRADITADGTEDPVAIPDLWGLRQQSALTQAGTIRHTGPAALAIRQETQYLHANHQRTRPPRALALALALFLYTLEPPAPPPMGAAGERGRVLFEAACASCHDNPVGGGGLVTAERIGTDPALASGEARGTGFYRTPALLAVRDAAPYLHDGTVPTLEDLLSTERFEADYAGNPHGPGPVMGHRYGVDLTEAERAELIAYLRAW